MMRRSLALKIVVATLALAASSVWAQDGLEGALSQANFASTAHLREPFSRTLAAADFDGDNKPDGAVLIDHGRQWLQSSFRTIELHFTGRGNADLTFESNETTLAISALDVNRDGAADIVIEQPFTHKRLQVWLNDGHGGFHKGRIQDFPSDDNATCDRFDPPSPRPDCLALCLPPQRGTETAKLTTQPLASLPPSSYDVERFARRSSPNSPTFSPSLSRAPPSIAL